MATVKVEGIRELDRAFKLAESELRKELRQEMRKAGQIVSDEARRLIAPFNGRTATGIRPRMKSASDVFVEQRRSKVTGAHPEWGAFQMRHALIPAREAKSREVIESLEDMLDRIGRRTGF